MTNQLFPLRTRVPVPHDLFMEDHIASEFRWRNSSAKGIPSEMRRRHLRTMIAALRELRADMQALAKRNEMRSV